VAETIIEVAGGNNESVLFGQTGERLRGRWSAHKLAGRSSHESLAALHAALPDGHIPGICLAIDPAKRTARRFDPLRETEEGQRCWKAMGPVMKDYAAFLPAGQPWDTMEVANMTDDQLKTWAYDMRNFLDCGLARHVSGSELPALEEIRAMKGARVQHNWMGPRKQRLDVVDKAGGPITQTQEDVDAAVEAAARV
jgi:hypothetical protein